MRALVKRTPGPGLSLEQVDKPVPEPNEVLVRVSHAAICGTDLHIYEWDDWAAGAVALPVIVGHEFVGTVVEVGSQVRHIRVGMRVAGEGHVTCGHCRNCRAGDGHLCRNTISVGIQRDGGFADFVAIPAANAYEVPASVPDEVAAILDPLGNAVHTALSFDLVGEDVLITGAGPIGQMAAAICRHAGARHVVVTDTVEARREMARTMGATMSIGPGEASIRAAMDSLGMTEGFDVAFEMSGNSRAVADILAVATHGAKVGLLGLFPGPTQVHLNDLIFKGLTVKGIYGREIFGTWYKAVSMLESGLRVHPVISHRFALEDYEAAIKLLQSGEGGKVLLEMGSPN